MSCPSTSRRGGVPGQMPVASGLTALLTPMRCCASAGLANPIPSISGASAVAHSGYRTIAIVEASRKADRRTDRRLVRSICKAKYMQGSTGAETPSVLPLALSRAEADRVCHPPALVRNSAARERLDRGLTMPEATRVITSSGLALRAPILVADDFLPLELAFAM